MPIYDSFHLKYKTNWPKIEQNYVVGYKELFPTFILFNV